MTDSQLQDIILDHLSRRGGRDSLSAVVDYLRGPVPGSRGTLIGPARRFPARLDAAEDELIRLGFRVETDDNCRRSVTL